MSRDDGFLHADIDTDLFNDPKVKALVRRLSDPVKGMVGVGLYTAAVLASWRRGEPVTVEDAQPSWWLAPIDEYVMAMIAVGLIEESGMVPDRVWERWHRPARQRRLPSSAATSSPASGRRVCPSRTPTRKLIDAWPIVPT